MDPASLKAEVRRQLVFWGGGVDTQQTLPFGTADEVRAAGPRARSASSAGRGFVFNTVHNVQARTPTENVLAMFEAVRDTA